MVSLSVVINTAPGREANLKGCLTQLTQQTFQDFEVLVADDGSEAGEATARAFENQLNLRYFWRRNDLCVNRSRNTGIAASQSRNLVLLDGDCLLNPKALSVYQRLLNKHPQALWSGYFGYIRQYTAPSALLKGRYINYLDRRVLIYSQVTFKPSQQLIKTPAQSFWGANIAFPKAVWDELGGFDESFEGWGNNDTDFGFRALEAGYQIHFCLDSWGEHQIHEYTEKYHQRFSDPDSSGQQFFNQRKHPPVNYQMMLYASPEGLNTLWERIHTDYIQQDPGLAPGFKAKLRQPQVRLMLRNLKNDEWQLGYAFPQV